VQATILLILEVLRLLIMLDSIC